MSKLVRLAILVGLAIWAWRRFAGRSEPPARAGVSYAATVGPWSRSRSLMSRRWA